MEAHVINGKEISEQICEDLALKVKEFERTHRVTPCVALINIGNDPASKIYVSNKVKLAEKVGIKSILHELPEDISFEAVSELISCLNDDTGVHGILLQLPIPKHLNADLLTNMIDETKDVDGLTLKNIGRLSSKQDALYPCTPTGVVYVLKQCLGDNLSGLHAVVIGRSNIVGKPVAQMLLIHLVSQWSEECDLFNIAHLNCYGASSSWRPHAESMLASLNIKSDENQYACFITTIASFVLPPFQNVLDLVKNNNFKTLVVVDEVHNIGADIVSSYLPNNATFRIALSATPERWFDEEGTDAIQNYFGKTVVEYGLGDAIQDNRLTPYYYYPVVAELTEKETYDYLEISQKLSQYLCIPEEDRNSKTRELIKQLLMKRARLQASAENKMRMMFDIIREKYTKEKHMLVYCGDGSVNTSDGDYSDSETYIRQVDYVVRELGVNLNMKVFPFTSRQDAKKRVELRNEFAKGELQALVAIRCLDEGVDIPATKIAFILASSTNPRQFIQRRGRVLRLSPETGKEFAIIYDFIVTVPHGYSDDYFKIERSLLRRELVRVKEFASLAKNKYQALNSLREIKNNYNLLDI